MKKYMCGIDLGGTKINTGIIDRNGEVISNIIIDTKAQEGQVAVIDRMIKSVYDVATSAKLDIKELAGIGIGVPGLIDSKAGLVFEAANLPGWKDVPIVELFTKEFGVPIKLENDANAAAYGEYLFGSGKGIENFIYMTVSTGIGGGSIINGNLYSGANSNASEIGHSIIDFNGPKCNCGNYGCFEAFASGTALARFAKESIDNGRISMISKLSDHGNIKSEHVFAAAKAGDELAIELIDKEAFYLGIGIVNMLAFYNPERIAVGGGVSNEWDMLSDKVLKVVEERALKPNAKACTIVKAKLGKNVGLLGAAGIVIS